MMELLSWTGPAAVRVEYRNGRPRDVDGPTLAAEVLGRLLTTGEPARTAAVAGTGQIDGLGRLWPMVEAIAGRPLDVAFVAGEHDADVVVDVTVDDDSARGEARRVGGAVEFQTENRVRLADPTGVGPPLVGGLDMPAWWQREEEELVALRGRRCPACRRVEYPAPPAGCPACGTELEPHVVSTAGRVLTWTVDQLYESRVRTGMAVVELTGGGRFYGQLADGWVDELATGAAVRLVPRVLHADERRTAYFWKITTAEEDHRG